MEEISYERFGVNFVTQVVTPERVAQFAQSRLAFQATIPIALRLDVRVAGATHRYSGHIEVPLRLSVRAVDKVTLVIDVDPVRADAIDVSLAADGVRARVLQRLGNVDDQVRRTVATIVNERLSSDAAREARVLDILSFVDKAWNPDGADG